ncbi:MAG: DUF2155 domain-containing protein [Rhizobiales bacterium]|nr:DUF2155 domain-containing protein [Hyphomicrobiales bacterium]
MLAADQEVAGGAALAGADPFRQDLGERAQNEKDDARLGLGVAADGRAGIADVQHAAGPCPDLDRPVAAGVSRDRSVGELIEGVVGRRHGDAQGRVDGAPGLVVGARIVGDDPVAVDRDPDVQVAILQGLDKITARISPIYATLGLPTYFGTLEIVVRACRETPPTEPPESAAFLEIRELPPAADRQREPRLLFSGWMFASSPAVSALEHAVYDVWVVDCEEPTAPTLSGQGVLETITPPSE